MKRPTGNHLLDGLPDEDFAAIAEDLEPVAFTLGAVLFAATLPPRYLYFPTTALVSLLFVTETGATAELAVAGREGVAGVGLFMGGEPSPSRAVIQGAGSALRLPAATLEREFKRGRALQERLLRFTQALLTQTSQTAVCNRYHTVPRQLCRWLLLCIDRVDGSRLRMTQQLIADMLGVRREGVAAAAARLQSWGCIEYSRGLITVIDRAGLERHACECYAAVNREYERLLGETFPAARGRSLPAARRAA